MLEIGLKLLGRSSDYIRATAVRFSDLGTFALPLPAKHADVTDLVLRLHGDRSGKHRGEPGFVTGAGRFVTPREALVIARQARQLRRGSIRDVGLQPENLIKMQVDVSLAAEGGTARSDTGWRPDSLQRKWVHTRSSAALATPEQLRRGLQSAVMVGLTTAAASWLVITFLAARALASAFASAVGTGTFVTMALTLTSYVLAGTGLALVLNGRGSRFRSAAVGACLASFALTCLSAVAALGLDHLVSIILAAALVADVLSVALAVTVRPLAAALLVPKMIWATVWLFGGVISPG